MPSNASFVQEIRPAEPLLNFVHDFKGYGMHPSQCRVRVFTDVPAYSIGEERWIVVFTELGIGTSVTNASEQIATEVLYKLPLGKSELGQLFGTGLDANIALALATVRGGFVTWIEHYPERGDQRDPIAESFDLVTFQAFDKCGPYYARGPENYGFSGANWKRTTRAEVERRIGGRFA